MTRVLDARHAASRTRDPWAADVPSPTKAIGGNTDAREDDDRLVKLPPQDSSYPASLCQRLDEPPTLTVSGPLITQRRVIAIVGSREPTPGAADFSFFLGYHLACANVIVVSGGAVGIDEMAHRGALRAAGTTWCVACTGRGEVFPDVHAELFQDIEQSDSSRMIWPFPDGTPKDPITPRFRNSVLVGLAEQVIVIQAARASGSRNAATWARRFGVPVLVAPGGPWDHAFEGSMMEIMRGAQPIWSTAWLFDKLGLSPPDYDDDNGLWKKDAPKPGTPGTPGAAPMRRPRAEVPPRGSVPRPAAAPRTIRNLPLFPLDRGGWNQEESRVFSALSLAPIQQDAIIAAVGLPTSSTLTALLTLSLKDVVVEGPDGFFRRRIAL